MVWKENKSRHRGVRNVTITIRVVLALVVGLGVAQLFRSVKNYNQRKDWTDILGIVAALLMVVGGLGLFIAMFGGGSGT